MAADVTTPDSAAASAPAPWGSYHLSPVVEGGRKMGWSGPFGSPGAMLVLNEGRVEEMLRPESPPVSAE